METKQNEGVIFKNTKKTPENKQPDYRGEIDCDGIKKEIALWIRKSEKGLSYFSVKLSEPWKKETSPKVEFIDKEQIQDDTPTDVDDLPF